MSASQVDPDYDLNNPDGWLPSDCPAWCDGVDAHTLPLIEGCGWEVSRKHSTSAGGECLSELTYAGRHVRSFGGSWEVNAEQRPLGPNGGYVGPVLVNMSIAEPGGTRRASLELTTGDALVLARRLIAMVDRIDAQR